MNLQNLFRIAQGAQIAYSVIILSVLLIEDAADGKADKKAEAIALIKKGLQDALGGVPVWLPDAVLGFVIDQTVALFNRTGVFNKTKVATPTQ